VTIVRKEGTHLIKELFSSIEARLKGPQKVVGEIIYGLLLHETVLIIREES
jgi:hypothetical protein